MKLGSRPLCAASHVHAAGTGENNVARHSGPPQTLGVNWTIAYVLQDWA